MNILRYIVLAGLTFSTAQELPENFKSEPEAVPPKAEVKESFSAPIVKDVASVNSKKQASVNFNNVRANTFNGAASGNPAAAFTVNDHLEHPHLFYGKKIAYIEPMLLSGAASFEVGDKTGILNLSNNSGVGVTSFGVATDSYGVLLDLGFNNGSSKNDNLVGGASTSKKQVGSGRYLGFRASKSNGEKAYFAKAGYETVADETITDTKDEDFSRASLAAGLANYPSDPDVVWSGSVEIERLNLSRVTTDADGSHTLVDDDAYLYGGVKVDLGTEFGKTPRAHALVGIGASLGYMIWDNVKFENRATSSALFELHPNLLGEFALTPSWWIFGGATHSVYMGLDKSTLTGPSTSDANVEMDVSKKTSTGMYTQSTIAQTGIRFQRSIFAAEASINAPVYDDGPASVFSNGSMFAEFAAMVVF